VSDARTPGNLADPDPGGGRRRLLMAGALIVGTLMIAAAGTLVGGAFSAPSLTTVGGPPPGPRDHATSARLTATPKPTIAPLPAAPEKNVRPVRQRDEPRRPARVPQRTRTRAQVTPVPSLSPGTAPTATPPPQVLPPGEEEFTGSAAGDDTLVDGSPATAGPPRTGRKHREGHQGKRVVRLK
jgi:hypothetical protein